MLTDSVAEVTTCPMIGVAVGTVVAEGAGVSVGGRVAVGGTAVACATAVGAAVFVSVTRSVGIASGVLVSSSGRTAGAGGSDSMPLRDQMTKPPISISAAISASTENVITSPVFDCGWRISHLL